MRELLDVRDAGLFEREPHAILESFLLLQQHAELKGMTAPTLRALWRARRRIDSALPRRSGEPRDCSSQILQQPRGLVHELRRMNQYGDPRPLPPAFGKIVGQMQHDLFHVYTVDQHILMVVRNLRRFTMVEFAHEYPLCSRLAARFRALLAALRRGALPRHRQGPRRRPFPRSAARRAAASAAPTACRARTRSWSSSWSSTT